MDNIQKNVDNVITNKYFTAILVVIIVIYHSVIGFKLPDFLVPIISHPIFTFIILILIAFVFAFNDNTEQPLKKSIFVAIIFLISMNILNGNLFSFLDIKKNKEIKHIEEETIESELEEVNKLLSTIENNNLENTVNNNLDNTVDTNTKNKQNIVQNITNQQLDNIQGENFIN
tara:strand:- start:110 stop:628 length:519 start_codon:yes stop_codon:yes gene_type:complete